MKVTKNINEANAITGTSQLNLSTIFSAAILSEFIPDMKLSFQDEIPKELPNISIAFEISGSKYSSKIESGVPHSSFSMMWDKLEPLFLKLKLPDVSFEKRLLISRKLRHDFIPLINEISNGYIRNFSINVPVIGLQIALNEFNDSSNFASKDEARLKAIEYAKEFLDDTIKNLAS